MFVKEFELPVDDTHPARTRRLETRLLVCDKNGAVYVAEVGQKAVVVFKPKGM